MAPRSQTLIRISDWLGQLSFPLYCVHVPVRTLVEATLGGLPWKVQIVLSVVLSVLVSMLLVKLLDQFRARQRLSKILRPITG
jgi:peptidoglycan/LPS O-acetylase OafA/YrhL